MNTQSIGKESIADPLMAGHGTVGTAEALLTGVPSYPIFKWLIVRADSENTGDILVAAPGRTGAGFILHAGESTPPIFVDATGKIAVVGSEAAQAFSWLGQ